jgi:hypothetical protein
MAFAAIAAILAFTPPTAVGSVLPILAIRCALGTVLAILGAGRSGRLPACNTKCLETSQR